MNEALKIKSEYMKCSKCGNLVFVDKFDKFCPECGCELEERLFDLESITLNPDGSFVGAKVFDVDFALDDDGVDGQDESVDGLAPIVNMYSREK